MKSLLTIFIPILAITSFSNDSFFQKDDFQVALGAQAHTLFYKRGIITYKGHQFVPLYAITLFNPNLLLAGSSLYFNRSLSKNLLLRLRLNFNSTNDDPLYITSEEENVRIRRETTSEFDTYLEYQFTPTSFVRFNFSQDLVEHNGHYGELRARIGVLDLVKNDSENNSEKSLAELGFFSSIGYGNSHHNRYLYGPNASSSSLNNIEYGISILSPKVIDIFWPTFRVTRFHILGESNKNGNYVQETAGWSVEALAAFRVW